MNITGVSPYYKQSTKDTAATSGKEKAEKIETKLTDKNKDTVEISANQKAKSQNTYNVPGKSNSYDSNSIEKLKSDYETQVNDFKNMLRKMISDQSLANGGKTETSFNFSFNLKFESNLNVPSSSTTEGENGISTSGFGDNDYWGAEQTANRIFDFATSLAGEDDKLLATLKDSVLKGFKEVEKLFGGEGKLPSVCYDTLDRVNQLFDQKLNPQSTEE